MVIFAITAKFQAEKIENQLEASYQNMQNVYSSVEKILTSSGITVKNFGETKINAIKEYVKQHANNPELMMKWVQENPQQIDSKIWENFQKQIEIQYTKFEMEQKNKNIVSLSINPPLINNWNLNQYLKPPLGDLVSGNNRTVMKVGNAADNR